MKHSTQKTSPEYEILYFDMEDPAPWESGFIEVDCGYSVQAVASAPVDGRANFRIDWVPCYPTDEARKTLRKADVERAFGSLWRKLQLYYRYRYGFVLSNRVEHMQ